MTKKLIAQDVLNYEQAVLDLKAAKKNEIDLRNKIIGAFRYDSVEGVQHKSVEGIDMDILITLGLGRSIDESILESIWDNLDSQQQSVITYPPKLNVAEYKKLLIDGEAGELINAITEKRAQAKVTLKYDPS